MYASGLTATRYLAMLQVMLAEQGVAEAELLAGTGLDARRLHDPMGFADREQLRPFLDNVQARSTLPFPFLALGRRLNVSAHGTIGFAGLTAPNAHAAMQLTVRYFALVTSLVRLQILEQGERVELVVEPLPDLTPAEQEFLLHTLLGSLDLMGIYLVGGMEFEVDLALPEQPGLREQLGASVRQIRFARSCHRFTMPARLLQVPFALADQAAHERALHQCEQELAALARQANLADRLYHELLTCAGPLPGIEQIAGRLGMSSRTLHRQLEAEGVRFRDLQVAARISKARRLLGEGMGITATAFELGYRDSANFTRAFRRATGMTPTAFLRRHRHASDQP